MQENNLGSTHMGNAMPGKFKQFLWWLATAEKDVLANSVADRNRYAIVGMTVMGTWIFATLAWTYFFSTVTASWLVSVLLGALMGGIVLSIDRALIQGIRSEKRWQVLPLVLRGALALVIGLFMAQPALLFLFKKDIAIQTSLDQEKRISTKRALLDEANAPAHTIALTKRDQIRLQLDHSRQEVEQLRNNFIAETDGTGGSRKVGMKDIARAKEQAYQAAVARNLELEQRLLPDLRSADSSLAAIESAIQAEQTAFAQLEQDGFLTRIEALEALISTHPALAFRYYLLVALLMLIELMPVIAKMMLPQGSYDENMRLIESRETTMAQKDHDRLLAFQERERQLLHEKDLSFMETALTQVDAERTKRTESQLRTWNDQDTPLPEFWRSMKKQLLLQSDL